jgi:hypothetical protein
MTETQVIYGAGDIARFYKVSPAAVSNWLRRGTGPISTPAFITVGGHVFWTQDQFDRMPKKYKPKKGRPQADLRVNRLKELSLRDT